MHRYYTRRGDAGETSLFNSERVAKNSPRVEAFGSVDELQSYVGLARSLVNDEELDADMRAVQGVLGGVMAELASTDGSTWIVEQDVSNIEALCDKYAEYTADWKPKFVVPGDSPESATLHVARTIARRAERRVVTFVEEQPVQPVLLQYLNRVSDLLYVMAIYVDFKKGLL